MHMNRVKTERGQALVDGLILLIFLIVVPLLLLLYCGGRLRRCADWGASHLVCRRGDKSPSTCAGNSCRKPAPAVKTEATAATAPSATCGKPAPAVKTEEKKTPAAPPAAVKP